jgi:hypothetical protein
MKTHLLAWTLCTATAAAAGGDLGGWPSFAGNGTFTPPAEGMALVTSPAAVRVAWRLRRHMGVQKSNAAGEGEFYGGTACVIASSDGVVFASYIRPAGDVLNEKRTNRYYPLEKQPRTMRQIDAEDVTIAVDGATGRLLWTAEEKGAGMNFLFGIGKGTF